MDKPYAVFDMDGTLIDSMGYWRDLSREYLCFKDITADIEYIVEEVAPLTMSESSALFVERFQLDISSETAAEEMNHLMETHYRNDIPLKKGVRELLEELQKSGVKMCVASATSEQLLNDCLKRLGILRYFDFILSCETLNTHKREPRIYLKAAECFKADPAEIAVYEDALYAIETAKKSGFYVVAVHDAEESNHWDTICTIADEIANIH